jgi:peptidoglycan hydrolase-like protein with peptidoglycan-binding domain
MADTFNKRLNTSDVFTIPYEANKLWNLNSSSFSDYNINFELGIFPTQSNKRDYNRYNLIYKLILANYYPEFYPNQSHSTSSYFQTNNLRSDLSTASYSNGLLRLGNLKTTEKYFPTSTGSFIYVINIPKSLYSEKIIPTTFELEFNGGKLYDDGEYNLRFSSSGFYSEPSASSLIKLNVGTLPQQLQTLTIVDPISPYENDVFEITTRNSNNTFTITTPIYLNSSSFSIRYLTSSVENGTDLTAYSTLSTVLTANHQGPFLDGDGNPLTISPGSINIEINNLYSLIDPPEKTISDFTGSSLILTIPGVPFFTQTPGGPGVSNTAVGILQPNLTTFELNPPWRVGTLGIPSSSGSVLTLTATSASFQSTPFITQSSVVFPVDVVDASGSITVGGNNYKIVNRLSGVSVEIDTPILYTSPNNFILEYSESVTFTDGTISAGGLETVNSPFISSSIGTILSQSSYVGNIFYEQGLGVLTVVPKSMYTQSVPPPPVLPMSNSFVITTSGAGSPGNETTYFGNLTKQALIRFQQKYNITPAVGYFGTITREKMKSLGL